MTPLARAIQAHENAAVRPMGDDEAQKLSPIFDDLSYLNVLPIHAEIITQIVRKAYAAGVKAGKGEGNA